MERVYEQVMRFKKKYPFTIAFRLRKHARVIEEHLNPGEQPLFSFYGQKNSDNSSFFETCVVCITNERILIGQDYLLIGYALNSITPDLFNDMQVYKGILWGKVTIDTLKETINISNLDNKSLPEVETAVSSYMMEAKKKYGNLNRKYVD